MPAPKLTRTIFGASWGTSLTGYVLATLTYVDVYLKSGQLLPTDPQGWTEFLIGLGLAVLGRSTRQTNVSSEQSGVK